jgi:SAM-dependent methyltransferase
MRNPVVVDDPKGHWQVTPHAEDYDRGRFSDLKGRVYRWLEGRAMRRALRPLARTDRVLDAACGTGRITSFLLREGFTDVVASDISPAMMAVAQRHLAQVSFHQADVTSLPFEDASFDTVTCVGLLMHLDEATRLRALRELARVSRRSLVIQYGCVGSFLRVATWLMGREPGGVRHSVAEADMRRDLQRVGLREQGRFWALRPFSTSVILLLSK